MHALGALLLALQLATGAGSAEAGRFAGFGRMPAEPPATAPAVEQHASPSAFLCSPHAVACRGTGAALSAAPRSRRQG